MGVKEVRWEGRDIKQQRIIHFSVAKVNVNWQLGTGISYTIESF
jgi:hypothetical protein